MQSGWNGLPYGKVEAWQIAGAGGDSQPGHRSYNSVEIEHLLKRIVEHEHVLFRPDDVVLGFQYTLVRA